MSPVGKSTIEEADPLARACELVGRFVYYFSRVEQQLDAAITKLFKLDPAYAPIVTANLDFYKKLQVVQCAVDLQTKAGMQITNAKRTLNRVAEVNNDRQVVAHSPFDAGDPDGVQFKRTVAKGQLKIEACHWTEKEFEQRFKKLKRLEANLEQIIKKLEPKKIKWPPAANTAPLPAYLSPAFFGENTPLALGESAKRSR
jgi:3-methyladenine DNA glycosylase/8-oxoguanine DNA glycosylase